MKKTLLGCALAAISLPAIAQPCTPPTLLAHWDFTNGSYADQIQGWTGVPNGGSITQVAGKAGTANTAIHFDGASWLQVPHDNAMNLSSWTISAIVRPTAMNTEPCQGNSIIWRAPHTSTAHYNIHFTDNPQDDVNGSADVCADNSGHYTFVSGTAMTSPIPSPFPVTSAEWLSDVNVNPAVATNQWYCVTASYNANTEMMDLYVDGTHIVSEYWPNWHAAGTHDLFIGASDAAGSGMFDYFFTGDIDDIKIYSGPIECSDDEFLQISKIICPSCPPRVPKEIAHWDFDGGNLNDVVNGWTPLPLPMSNPPSTSVAGILGAPNTAMHFNQGEFLRFAHDPMMDLKSWTIAATVRPNPRNYWTGPCQGNYILNHSANGSSQHYHLEFYDNYQNTGRDCDINLPDKLFAGFPAGTATWTEDKWNSAADPAWASSPLRQADNPFIDNTPPGRWYCVTLSYDAATGALQLFVDGDRVFEQFVANQYSYFTPEDLFIGASGFAAPFQYFFDGDMDDIKLYDVALICPPACDREGRKPSGIGNANGTMNKLLVAPNPATDNINITVPSDWGNGQIVLLNAMGQQVMSQSVSITDVKVDISSLPAGFYTLRAQFGSHTASQKVIKN
ncbi:MAG: T9SS type A sorting domain-containing protein [Sphingobacteriales bacterium]|nr:MAG: T9SS type A sorting domain-containing protein [Sphingobacteriales bacterium]